MAVTRENNRKVGVYSLYDAKTTSVDSDEYRVETLLVMKRGADGVATDATGRFRTERVTPYEYRLFDTTDPEGSEPICTVDRLNKAKAEAAKIVLRENPA